MVSFRNKKIIFELSSISPLICNLNVREFFSANADLSIVLTEIVLFKVMQPRKCTVLFYCLIFVLHFNSNENNFKMILQQLQILANIYLYIYQIISQPDKLENVC